MKDTNFCGKLSIAQQKGDLEEIALFRQYFYGIASVSQDSFFSIDIGDFRRADGRVEIGWVVQPFVCFAYLEGKAECSRTEMRARRATYMTPWESSGETLIFLKSTALAKAPSNCWSRGISYFFPVRLSTIDKEFLFCRCRETTRRTCRKTTKHRRRRKKKGKFKGGRKRFRIG